MSPSQVLAIHLGEDIRAPSLERWNILHAATDLFPRRTPVQGYLAHTSYPRTWVPRSYAHPLRISLGP